MVPVLASRVLLGALCLSLVMLGWVAPAHADAPGNDSIESAVAFSIPFTDTVDTSEATYGAEDQECGAATVWYRFMPTESGWVEFNTAGSDFDTMLGLYLPVDGGHELVACNDDSVYGFQSQIGWDVAAGSTYYISVGTCCGGGEPGQQGPGGLAVFNANEAPPSVTDVDVDVARAGTVTREGTVTLSGTITCDQDAQYFLDLRLLQRFGRLRAEAYLFAHGMCGPEPTAWTAEATTSGHVLIGPGRATVAGSVFAFSGIGDGFFADLAEQRVSLRRARG